MSHVVPGINDLQTLYPNIAKLWHPTFNGTTLPSGISANNHNKYYWLCPKGHPWQASPNTLVQNSKKNGSCGCSVCSGKVIIKGINDLASQAPEIAAEWDYEKNNPKGITPETVSVFSGKIVSWIGKCGHRWPAVVNDRVRKHTGCKYCDKKELLTGVNDLLTIAPDLCSQWDYKKNEKNPQIVVSNDHNKYWWKCEFGHSWEESPNRRIQRYKRNHFVNCPKCTKYQRVSFPEKCLFFYISQLFNDAIENYTIPETRQELDIYIPSQKIAIEYDGAAFHTKEKIKNDEKKNRWSLEQGIKMIRIREDLCPALKNDGQYTISISKEPSECQLDESINKTLQFISIMKNERYDLDINVQRDSGKIRKMMKQYLVNNSIAKTNPEILAEWDYEKNNELGLFPEGITSGSSTIKVWWRCPMNHSYDKSPNEKIRLGKGCPYCTGKKLLKGFNDLASVYPEVALMWNYSENNGLSPEDVIAGSSKKYHWYNNDGSKGYSSVSDKVISWKRKQKR